MGSGDGSAVRSLHAVAGFDVGCPLGQVIGCLSTAEPAAEQALSLVNHGVSLARDETSPPLEQLRRSLAALGLDD